jgi:hypothetical protein
MTCGGCLMATPSRAEFAASTIVSNQAVLVGCGAWAMAVVQRSSRSSRHF